MTTLVQHIMKLKELSPSSARTYASVLKSMFTKLDLSGEISESTITKNIKPIITFAKKKPIKQRKQLLSAILLFVQHNEKLVNQIKPLMSVAAEQDHEQQEKQQLTDNQKRSWMDWNDIISIRSKLEETVSPLWDKERLSNSEFQLLQDYVIVCLYSYNPPRRAVDYCVMRKGEPRSNKENGIRRRGQKMSFIFNSYKTSKEYGSQTIQVDSELRDILKKWIALNPCDWLIVGNGCNPMSSSSLSQRLSRIFNKPGFGINILRHAYVSDVALKNMPFLKDLKKTAEELGHSSMETILYKKHH
jgi:hypothetical protein